MTAHPFATHTTEDDCYPSCRRDLIARLARLADASASHSHGRVLFRREASDDPRRLGTSCLRVGPRHALARVFPASRRFSRHMLAVARRIAVLCAGPPSSTILKSIHEYSFFRARGRLVAEFLPYSVAMRGRSVARARRHLDTSMPWHWRRTQQVLAAGARTVGRLRRRRRARPRL